MQLCVILIPMQHWQVIIKLDRNCELSKDKTRYCNFRIVLIDIPHRFKRYVRYHNLNRNKYHNYNNKQLLSQEKTLKSISNQRGLPKPVTTSNSCMNKIRATKEIFNKLHVQCNQRRTTFYLNTKQYALKMNACDKILELLETRIEISIQKYKAQSMKKRL